VALRPGRRTAPVVLELAPDRGKRLSDATLVEASIAARLLGMRLLTLDATIALVPADLTAPMPALADGAPRVNRSARASSSPSSGDSHRRCRTGHRLADATRNLDEGARLLAEVQRNGAQPRWGHL
jgi:hypothetical protein